MKLALELVATLAVLLAYFASESLLRRRVYFSRVNPRANEVVTQLPEFIRKPLEDTMQRRVLLDKLEATGNPYEKADIRYQLATTASDREAQRQYRAIVDALGPHPKAIRARGQLMLAANGDPAKRTQVFIQWLRNLPGGGAGSNHEPWRRGLRFVSQLGDEDAFYLYAGVLAEIGAVHPELTDLYRRLRGLAARRGDKDLLTLARGRQEQCQDMSN